MPVPGLPRGLLPLLTALIFVWFMDGRVMTAMLPEIAYYLGMFIASAGLGADGLPAGVRACSTQLAQLVDSPTPSARLAWPS